MVYSRCKLAGWSMKVCLQVVSAAYFLFGRCAMPATRSCQLQRSQPRLLPAALRLHHAHGSAQGLPHHCYTCCSTILHSPSSSLSQSGLCGLPAATYRALSSSSRPVLQRGAEDRKESCDQRPGEA